MTDGWTFKAVVAFALVAVLTLGMCACSETQIISAVEVAIDAAEVALPLVAGLAGVPPALVAQLLDYLQAASQALSQVSAVLAKGGSQASIAVQITQILSTVVSQDAVIQQEIGPLGGAVAAAISAVMKDIQNILNTYGAPSTTAKATFGSGTYHFTGKNLARLDAAQAKAIALAAKIEAAKAKPSPFK